MDNSTNIEEIRENVRKFVRDREWEQFHNPQDLSVSISIEAAELLEIFQWDIQGELDEKKTKQIKEELADIMIYCLSLANSLELDISEIISEKIKLNALKYPINKYKGSSKKYQTNYMEE